jgi:hypothetical protein
MKTVPNAYDFLLFFCYDWRPKEVLRLTTRIAVSRVGDPGLCRNDVKQEPAIRRQCALPRGTRESRITAMPH